MPYTHAKKTPQVSGIDALYYFAQSGGLYDRFFESIMEQIAERKAYFERLNYAYADNDIIFPINGISVMYSGKGRDGFHWFAHEYFRAGFKDSEKSPNIHNIRIQLNAVGIYKLGIKSLVAYINTKFLDQLTMNYFPVTRIDLNTFVQHDFKYLRKEMILSKKKSHSANIAERSTGYELETYYVGKKPFLLRIYNKRRELQGASILKQELMQNHFKVNGLDANEPIFNVEFEMHREYLKQYGIDTIEDALSRAETLFKHACDLVRLIDMETIGETQRESYNRRRAKTLPIWEEIKERYSIEEFMQVDTPLNKIEKVSARYTLQDGEKSLKKIITRLLIHGNTPTHYYFLDVLQKAKEEFELKQNIKELHTEHKVQSFEEELRHYSNEGLRNLEEALLKEMPTVSMGSQEYDDLFRKYDQLWNEFVRRGLRPDF